MRKALAFIACLAVMPAYADHPGDRLDEAMARKEPAFEAVDRDDLPVLNLLGPDGASLDLDSLSDQVIVLSFVPVDCGAPCADQQALLARVRDGVNASPMLGKVTFLVVSDADDPVPEPLAQNVIVARPQAPIGKLVAQYRTLVADAPDAPLIHVIARGNRHAGVFIGSGVRHINLILYINGLTNGH